MPRLALTRFCLAAAVLAASATTHAAAEAPVARGLIVQLKAAPEGRESAQAVRERLATVALDTGLPSQNGTPVGDRQHLLRFDQPLSGAALEAAERRMRLNPQVASVEPDVRMKRQAEPNDTYYASGSQAYLRTPAAGNVAAINLPPVWAVTQGRPDQVVAVVDSGVDKSHPDLAGKLLPGYDMVSDAVMANDGDGRDADPSDPGDWVTEAELSAISFFGCEAADSSWHGTFIAGQVAAATNNGAGVAGVNWNAKVLPVRVSGKCGAWLSDVADGIRWAAGLAVSGVPANPNPARVINVSFGGAGACGATYQAAIDAARAVRSLVVVSAGNESGPLTRPANCSGVLSVGAVGQDGLKTWYSNYGGGVSVMAPGGAGVRGGPALFSTLNAGLRGPQAPTYGTKSGTSFAAPLVAGVASLMLAANSTLSPDELISRIQSGSRPFPNAPGVASCESAANLNTPCNCTTASCGAGLLDAAGAMQLAASPAVAIAPVDPVAPGGTFTLDGRSSTPSQGAQIVAYQWSQVSGPGSATIAAPGQAQTSVTLPAGQGSWVFRLVVSDSAGRSADNYVTVTTREAGGSDGDSGDGGGGGATSWWWGLGLWLVALAGWRQRRGSLRG